MTRTNQTLLNHDRPSQNRPSQNRPSRTRRAGLAIPMVTSVVGAALAAVLVVPAAGEPGPATESSGLISVPAAATPPVSPPTPEPVAGEPEPGASEPGASEPGTTEPAATELDEYGLPTDNLIKDPSFEVYTRRDPGQPWWNFADRNSRNWVQFSIAEGVARTGEHAAHIHIDSAAPEQDDMTAVHGVVQEIATGTVPRYMSGWYRVENWQRGAERQYLQVVVIAHAPQRLPEGLSGLPNVQVAMTMAGVSQPPLQMGNRRFEVTGPVEPVEGEWIFFEFDVREMFQKHWGLVPEGMDWVRVFYEARYDQRRPGPMTPEATADVYFDDLYLGDTSRAHEARSD